MTENVWLTGYGCEIGPLVPFAITQEPNGTIITAHVEDSVMIAPGADRGVPQVFVHPDTANELEVFQWVDLKPWTAGWNISTPWFTIPWPHGTTLYSATSGRLFELGFREAPLDEMVYVEGGFDIEDVPSLYQFSDPDIVEVASGELNGQAGTVRWTEVESQESRWRHRRYLVPCAGAVMLVTAQTPDAMGVVFAVADRIAREMVETPE